MTSVRNFYISNSLKKKTKKQFSPEKFGNVLAFDQESKTKQAILF